MNFKEFVKSVKGLPYIISPLEGEKEVLVTRTDKFDCVTLVEHYLASCINGDYKENLKRIRYFHSKVSFQSRKHYLSTWLKDNQKIGLIKRIVSKNEKTKKNILNIINKIPTIENSIKFGKSEFKSGDLICFASSNKNLDYFHIAIAYNKEKIIHASKVKDKVIVEQLSSFLKRTNCIGYTVYRIKDPNFR